MDMEFFRVTTSATKDPTKRNAVIMGRKTWDGLGRKPLKGRLNLVLTRSLTHTEGGAVRCTDVDSALRFVNESDDVESVFVIGGGEVYEEFFRTVVLHSVYVTLVHREFEDCDATFVELPPGGFERVELYGHSSYTEHGIEYEFLKRGPKRANLEERQYLDLVREVLDRGAIKTDRTGTGTKSLFGRTMRFSLRDGVVPLLTTKRVFWRAVVLELLWFISGDTSAKTLQDQNVHIWDGNGTRAYLDSIGLYDREEGDLGPIYGFQWRHFGAQYKTAKDDYEFQGVDQLKALIRAIKTDPDSRRMILSAWNAAALSQMALPPCHVLSQFYVTDGELSCQMYQRSADMGLGVPFNLASYALFTHILARCCGLKAGELVHVIGDCHAYANHESALREQLEREPRPFPTLVFKTDTTNVDDFVFEDFELVGYDPHPTIKMDMAV